MRGYEYSDLSYEAFGGWALTGHFSQYHRTKTAKELKGLSSNQAFSCGRMILVLVSTTLQAIEAKPCTKGNGRALTRFFPSCLEPESSSSSSGQSRQKFTQLFNRQINQ